MNLHQRLEKIRIDFETGETPKEVVDVLNAHVEHLIRSGTGKDALKVGDSAPTKLVAWSDEESISLHDCFGDRFLVLSWFRGNW